MTRGSGTMRSAASGRVGLGRRLRIGTALFLGLRRRDWRSGMRLMNHMFAGQPLPVRFIRLGLWSLKAAYIRVPDAAYGFDVATDVSRTPYWLREGNPFTGYPWSEGYVGGLPGEAEVVVVGAGFGGACVSYHWARMGQGALVLLDKDAPAEGAAGRNAGFLTAAGGSYHGYYIYEPVRAYVKSVRPELSEAALDAIAEGYCDLYMKALERSVDAIHATIARESIDCDLQQNGGFIVSDHEDAERVQRALDLGRRLDWPNWRRVEPVELRELTGVDGRHFAGLQEKTSTWHPAKWVWGLVKAALASGKVFLFTGVEAMSVVRDGDAFLVNTSRGTIRARHVVNATEAYTAGLFRDFLPHQDPDLVRPHKSQAMFADGGAPTMQPARAVCFPLAWCHPRLKDMMLGSDNHRVPLREVSWNDPSRFVTMFTAAEVVRQWPDAQFHLTREWTGTVGQAPDKAPVVGEMSVPGVYMLGGFAGAGSAISYGAAEDLVSRILGLSTDNSMWPCDVFGITRFEDPRSYGQRFINEIGVTGVR